MDETCSAREGERPRRVRVPTESQHLLASVSGLGSPAKEPSDNLLGATLSWTQGTTGWVSPSESACPPTAEAPSSPGPLGGTAWLSDPWMPLDESRLKTAFSWFRSNYTGADLLSSPMSRASRWCPGRLQLRRAAHRCASRCPCVHTYRTLPWSCGSDRTGVTLEER